MNFPCCSTNFHKWNLVVPVGIYMKAHAGFTTVELGHMDLACCSTNLREWNPVILIYITMQVSQQLKLVIWVRWGWKPVIPIGIYTKLPTGFATVELDHMDFPRCSSNFRQWNPVILMGIYTKPHAGFAKGSSCSHTVDLPHWPTESFFCVNCYTTDSRQWTWDCKFSWNSANITSCCKTTELNLLTSGLNSHICRVKPFWNKLIARKTQKIELEKCVFCRITMLLAMRKLLEGLALIYLCVFGIQSSFQLFIWRLPESG